MPQQVLEILTVSALRRKGLSLQKIRRVLRLMRRELGPQFSHALGGGPKLTFSQMATQSTLTNSRSAFLSG
jgi:DNA-binding transcriptional MerR regulator